MDAVVSVFYDCRFFPPKKSNDKILIDSVMMNLRRYVVRLARHFKVVPAGGVPKWVASNTTNVKTKAFRCIHTKGKTFLERHTDSVSD